jgi:hypothetical protein
MADFAPRTAENGPRKACGKLGDFAPRTADFAPRTAENAPRTADFAPRKLANILIFLVNFDWNRRTVRTVRTVRPCEEIGHAFGVTFFEKRRHALRACRTNSSYHTTAYKPSCLTEDKAERA